MTQERINIGDLVVPKESEFPGLKGDPNFEGHKFIVKDISPATADIFAVRVDNPEYRMNGRYQDFEKVAVEKVAENKCEICGADAQRSWVDWDDQGREIAKHPLCQRHHDEAWDYYSKARRGDLRSCADPRIFAAVKAQYDAKHSGSIVHFCQDVEVKREMPIPEFDPKVGDTIEWSTFDGRSGQVDVVRLDEDRIHTTAGFLLRGNISVRTRIVKRAVRSDAPWPVVGHDSSGVIQATATFEPQVGDTVEYLWADSRQSEVVVARDSNSVTTASGFRILLHGSALLPRVVARAGEKKDVAPAAPPPACEACGRQEPLAEDGMCADITDCALYFLRLRRDQQPLPCDPYVAQRRIETMLYQDVSEDRRLLPEIDADFREAAKENERRKRADDVRKNGQRLILTGDIGGRGW